MKMKEKDEQNQSPIGWLPQLVNAASQLATHIQDSSTREQSRRRGRIACALAMSSYFALFGSVPPTGSIH